MSNNFQSPGSTAQKPNQISPADLRILLWDVDGTLLQSNRPGGFKEYFAPALEKVYGSKGDLSNVSAAGATDTHIAFQALEGDGFTIEQISSRMDDFVAAVCVEMESFAARHENVYEILPGVKEILRATAENPRFVNALLTGNVSCGAEIKCQYVGIWQYFENSLNTYGDISQDRRELAAAAGKNFNEHYQSALNPQQFIVIGDTPNDIKMAKHFGAKIISVETGRGVERRSLEQEAPDNIIKDLSDTQNVLDIFENI